MRRLGCWLIGHEYRWIASDRTSECRRCGWCQIHETRCGAHPRSVTVTLTCDTTAYVAAITNVAWHVRLHAERRSPQMAAFAGDVALQRTLARWAWTAIAEDAWARYGWERPADLRDQLTFRNPEPPGRVVWWRQSDVDEQGNVHPIMVAHLGEPQRPADTFDWSLPDAFDYTTADTQPRHPDRHGHRGGIHP